jgi:hypothetical protein
LAAQVAAGDDASFGATGGVHPSTGWRIARTFERVKSTDARPHVRVVDVVLWAGPLRSVPCVA